MTLTPEKLFGINYPLWFCLRSQPKREHIAATALRKELGINCFAPRLRFRRAASRGTMWFVEALFPSYLFAEFVYSEKHRQVRSSLGVHGILQFGYQIAVIDPGIIQVLRQRSGDSELVTLDHQITIGEPVRVADGPFRGLEAIVTRLVPAKERVCILFQLLNRSVEIEASFQNVIPTVRPRM